MGRVEVMEYMSVNNNCLILNGMIFKYISSSTALSRWGYEPIYWFMEDQIRL